MSEELYIYLIIFGMAAGTYIFRELPFIILGDKELRKEIVLWLSFIPASVMAALLVPEIFVKKNEGVPFFNLALDNLYIFVGLATFIVSCIFKNFFITIVFGMGLLALLRLFF